MLNAQKQIHTQFLTSYFYIAMYNTSKMLVSLAWSPGFHLTKKIRIVPNLRKSLVLTLLLYLWSPSFRRIKTSAKPPPGMFFPSKSVMVTSPFHNWFFRKESESRILLMKLDWKANQGHKTLTYKPNFYAHINSVIWKSDMKSSELREV